LGEEDVSEIVYGVNLTGEQAIIDEFKSEVNYWDVVIIVGCRVRTTFLMCNFRHISNFHIDRISRLIIVNGIIVIEKCDFRNIRKYGNSYSYFGRVLYGNFICYIYIIGDSLKDITTKGVERNYYC
jgi:hypothetical protein